MLICHPRSPGKKTFFRLSFLVGCLALVKYTGIFGPLGGKREEREYLEITQETEEKDEYTADCEEERQSWRPLRSTWDYGIFRRLMAHC